MQPEQTPLVSVIVPVWNCEKFLPRCVDSILAQTWPEFELILVDDGSPDGCGAICDSYAKKDPRVRAIHKENGGVSTARNAGLDAAVGLYIFFVDADDAIEAHLMEYAMRSQLAHPDRLVMWELTLDEAELARRAAEPFAETLMRGLEVQMMFTSKGQGVQVWNKLFQAGCIKKFGMRFDRELGYEHNLSEDEVFFQQYQENFFSDKPRLYTYLPVPRYYHEMDNPESLVTRYEARYGQFKRDADAAKPGYAPAILEELRTNLTEYADLFAEPDKGYVTIRHYLRCLAYGAWCARELGEPLPAGYLRGPEVTALLDGLLARRRYTPYYLPFRLGSAKLVAAMYDWDNRKTVWYYRLILAQKLLLGGRWD